jgi:outer membrane protein TolC
MAFAADAPPVANTLVTSKHTPTADAPAFGTPTYFRKVFSTPAPKIELKAPVRLTDFVVDGKLELSLRNYLDLVLANNTDIQIQRLTIEQPRNAILRSYQIFDPVIRSSFQTTRQKSAPNDILAGAETLNTLNQPLQINATHLLPTGTEWTLGFSGSKSSSNNVFQSWNPAISTNLQFGFSQPLLRGRGMFLTKLPVTIAQSRLRQSEYNIQESILRLVTTAENAYWDVIFQRENLKVQEQNLALNEKLLERAKKEYDLGAISQLEIYQPEAQYKNAEISVTQARFRLQAAEDALRRQIGVDLDPNVRNLPVVLTESVEPPVQTAIDREGLVAKALQQRPDVRAARQTLDIDDLSIKGAANSLKPDLRLTGGYGTFGRGGMFNQRTNVFNPDLGQSSPVISVIPGGLGDALDQLFGFGLPTYRMGVQLNFPLRDRRAAADYADAVVQKRLDMLRIRAQEQNARLEVLNAITEVERARTSVDLARVALDLAQKRLEGDQKRYDLGTITLFFLLSAQTDFNQAQSNLVNQTVQYRRSLTSLLRVTGDLLTERGIAVQ